jgi:NAD(P)-dependent dehydrogenase (short-subunit alcohol dehydrogenase family)
LIPFKNEGLDAVALPLDVRSEQSAADAAEWVKREWGRIDLLVNNAGIGMRRVNPRFMIEAQPFFQVSPEGFRDVIETNFFGYFLVARAFTPVMLAQGKGWIVNISMNHAIMNRKGFVPYGLSRAADLIPDIQWLLQDQTNQSGGY